MRRYEKRDCQNCEAPFKAQRYADGWVDVNCDACHANRCEGCGEMAKAGETRCEACDAAEVAA